MTAVAEKAPKTVKYERDSTFFETALRKALRSTLLLDLTLKEKQDVRIKPGFNTACWSFQPPHKIFVGDKVFDKPNMRKNLDDDQLSRYIQIHYHHEMAHALYTERDLAKVQRALQSMGAPFQLFNLMEDAVIEHRYRKDNSFQFKWLEYEEMMVQERPEALLFCIIQAEGDLTIVEDAVALELARKKDEPKQELNQFDALLAELKPVTPQPGYAEYLPRVKAYYERIIQVRTSMALMPIIQAWVAEFGMPPPPSGGKPPTPGGLQDMSISMQLLDKDEREKFEQDTKPVTMTASGGSDDKESNNDDSTTLLNSTVADPNHEAIAQSADVLGERTNLDTGLIERLAKKFLPLFRATVRHISTMSPTKRISARHVALGRNPYRKPGIQARAKKNIFLMVDCSGSMRGLHIKSARELVGALSILAQKGHVEGHVVLSIISDRPAYQTFKLPMTKEAIERIEAYGGGEGLDYSLNANVHLAKNADHVLVFTDGNISDREIRKEVLHRKGVHTWGLYVGDNEAMGSLMKYFDKALVRDSVEELVDAILVQV